MKSKWFLTLLLILVASTITAAIIYREHWIMFVVFAASLLLMAVFMFLWSSSYKLLEYLIWPRGILSNDDRGNEVEFREIKKMPSGDQITKQDLTEAIKRTKKFDLSGVTIVLCATFLIGLGSWAFFYFTKIDLPLWADWLVSIFYTLMAFLVMRFIKVKFLIAYAKILLTINRCASCGYSLKELPLADDGCTICPECGAAWKLQPGIPQ